MEYARLGQSGLRSCGTIDLGARAGVNAECTDYRWRCLVSDPVHVRFRTSEPMHNFRSMVWISAVLLTCAVAVMDSGATRGTAKLWRVAAQPQPAQTSSSSSKTGSEKSATQVDPNAVPNPAVPGQKTSQAANQGSEKVNTPVWLEVLKVIITWPFVFAFAVLYFALSKLAPYKLARILKPFRSLKLFGTEFVLSEEVGGDAEQSIEIYRKQVKRQFDTLVEVYDIRGKLEAVMDDVERALNGRKKVADLRCTIHVPDILFADTLYQLLDYFPRGVGRGRTFSSRFGIIGLCWRSREPQIRGSVQTDPKILVRDWGMTHEQAVASGEGRQSFAAVPLRDESGSPVAIFYLDAKDKNVFGDDNGEGFRTDLIAAISEGHGKVLTASLVKMRDALKDRRPAIRIHEQ